MKFLVCLPGTLTTGDKWASAGEPVVPNFPTGYANSFLGSESFKPTMKAIVVEVPDLDIDVMSAVLQKQFPGLPKRMLDTYVLETAKAAHELPLGAECNVYTSWESTKIMDIGTGKLHVLWEKPPV